MNIKILVLIVVMAMSLQTVSAKILSNVPTTAIEEDLLVLTGKKLDATVNPISVVVKTADGSSITLNPTVISKNKISVQMPSVSADTKILVQISGGNIPTSAPEQFVILILDRPNIAGLDTQSDSATVLPSGVSGDFHASTADTVTTATQSAITALPSVTLIGATGVATTIKGSLVVTGGITGTASNALSANSAAVASSFSGSLSGDVTGTQGATSISSTTVIGKSLTGFSAVAGTVDATDTIKSAFENLVGNLALTDSTVAGHTTSLANHTTDISANSSAIAAQATTLANHSTDITANTSAIAAQATTLANHSTDITANSSAIAANTSAIAAQATTLTNHATEITANSSAIAAQATTLANHTTDITANSSAIAAQATTLANHTTAIATNATAISTLDSDLVALNGAVSVINGDLVTLNGEVAAINGTVANHASTLSSHTSTLSSQASSIATLVTDLATNATNIAANTSAIATNTSDIAANTTAIAGKQDASANLTAFANKTAPNGAVVGTSDVQNLTHKTLQDSTVSFADDGNIERVAKFELAGLTIGETRTITVPDASGTMTLLGNTKTGNGSVVLATSPVLTTPDIGDATATSVNKVLITAPATTATLALANNSSLNTVGAHSVTFDADADLYLYLPETSGSMLATVQDVSDLEDAMTIELNGKQAANGDLAAIAALNPTADKMIYATGTNTYATTTVTALARTNLAMGTALNVETTGTYDATGIGFVTFVDNSSTTDDVTTITGGVAGQKLTIVVSTTSANSVKFVDGSNLKLGGTYTAGVTDTLVLVCDGTNWYELSRGNN